MFEQNTGSRPMLPVGTQVDVSWHPEYAFLLDASQDVTRRHRGGLRWRRSTTSPWGASRERKLTGYWLILPGAIWLALFFVVPFFTLLSSSLYDPSGSVLTGYSMTWHFQNFADAFSEHWCDAVAVAVVRRRRHGHLPAARLRAGLRDRVQVRAAGRT